jgi:hypothetical protein
VLVCLHHHAACLIPVRWLSISALFVLAGPSASSWNEHGTAPAEHQPPPPQGCCCMCAHRSSSRAAARGSSSATVGRNQQERGWLGCCCCRGCTQARAHGEHRAGSSVWHVRAEIRLIEEGAEQSGRIRDALLQCRCIGSVLRQLLHLWCRWQRQWHAAAAAATLHLTFKTMKRSA